MPSVFSFQASAQRKVFPTPGLDWHFNHWQVKAPDENSLDKETSPSTTRGAGLDPPPPPSSSSSASSASSRFANARISGLTKKYSLASFSKIAGMDSSRRGSANVDPDQPGLTITSIRENGDGISIALDSDNESDFLYREGGFFDRQRALKRRRRPWPYSYAHEEDEESTAAERDPRKDGRSNIYGSLKRCIDASQKGNTWTDCVHCCKCACHHAACLRNKRMEYTEDSDADSGTNNEINGCKDQHFTAPSSFSKKASESGLDVKVTMALERITMLEEKLVEKTKVMDEHTVSMSSEITTLKQTVAILTAQLHNTENDVQEFQLQQSVPANTGGLDDVSMGHVSSCNLPPAPFSPAPSALDQQAESTPTAAPTFRKHTHQQIPRWDHLYQSHCQCFLREVSYTGICVNLQHSFRLTVIYAFLLNSAAQRLCMATVQSLRPRAQVRPYGSHVSRLVLPSSDVDLVICLPKVRRDAPA
ncbi:unnamed protein product [Peronospora destructor]|uniref:Polymerase nucleotidyl transferase domain-containing protein n=1 Tax=Peronospora destructor TaxID=86335 RepID=A0AAV0UUV9_9STRA|nr:unnamed protein product [Peronospora destructor]